MYGETVVPFEYAGVASGNMTRGLRPNDLPRSRSTSAGQYFEEMQRAGIVLDPEERKSSFLEQVKRAALFVGVEALLEEDLLAEVTNLVEKPTAVLGNFNSEYLRLPREVMISVMKKQQRYFPIEKNGQLMPNFVAIRNGDDQHLDLVQEGNEHVLGHALRMPTSLCEKMSSCRWQAYRPRLAGLTFHTKLGSMLDKADRIQKLVNDLDPDARARGRTRPLLRCRAARLCKADLVTKMVTEMTALRAPSAASTPSAPESMRRWPRPLASSI